MNKLSKHGYISDPEHEEWDGTLIGVRNAPRLAYNLQELSHYARDNKKSFKDLTEQEIEMFRIQGR